MTRYEVEDATDLSILLRVVLADVLLHPRVPVLSENGILRYTAEGQNEKIVSYDQTVSGSSDTKQKTKHRPQDTPPQQ